MSREMGIYKITNLTEGKAYIGQSRDIKKRMKGNISSLNGNHNNYNSYLKEAYIKYGKDDFASEILEIVSDISQLDERERYWIDYYKTCNREFGYNIATGGTGGYIMPKETRQKQSLKRLGKKLPPETIEKFKNKIVPKEVRDKISKTMKEKGIGKGKNNGMYGKHSYNFGISPSKETRQRISQSRKGQLIGKDNPFYGKKHTPETLAKISANRKGKGVGRKNTPEVIEKMAQIRKEYWANKKSQKE